MNEDIEQTKYIIKKQVDRGKVSFFGVPFSKHQRVYAFTNENIYGYMDKINFNDKENALTVLASGDHVYNLLCYGILDIDTFDTNNLTKYYALGLKNAMILRYNYEEFLKIFNQLLNSGSLDEISSLVLELSNYMDEEYQQYWLDIVDYNYRLQRKKKDKLNLFKMLLINVKDYDWNTSKNKYLENNDSYELMKKNMQYSKISFKNDDFFNFNNNFNKQYDLIFLSNILDYLSNRIDFYWNFDLLLKIYSYLDKLVSDNGIVGVSYFFNFYNERKNLFNNCPIMGSNVKYADVMKEEILTFPSFRNEMMDGLLIKRK